MVETVPSATGLRVLIADIDQAFWAPHLSWLQAEGHQVALADTPQATLLEMSQRAFDLVLLEPTGASDFGPTLIPRLLLENPWARVVVVTSCPAVDSAVQAMKRGASDYLLKPVSPVELRRVMESTADFRRRENKSEPAHHGVFDDPSGDFPCISESMKKVMETAQRVAASSAALLVRGEAGTGKSRLARAIHQWSNRASKPCSMLCCQGMGPDALEIELFGLSAVGDPKAPPVHAGRAARCDGGTLVLQEIGELPKPLQPRLLQLLRDKEYERANDATCRRADVRVIALSRSDLYEAVRRSTFRSDLLMAIDVVTVEILPLRQRPEDIRVLAEAFLSHFATQSGRHVTAFTADAMSALLQYSFPANVRELRNLVERAVLLCDGDRIALRHLPPNLIHNEACRLGDLVSLETISDLHIRRVLASTPSYEAAASVLGINSITLWRRRKRYGLNDVPLRRSTNGRPQAH
jgi:NtrC-family two-component system response regulator AlgB